MRSQSERRALEVIALEVMQEQKAQIQFFLLLLLREVEQVVEMVVAGFLPLVGQVVAVLVVAQLVLLEQLDRAVMVETALAWLVCKVVAAAVERVLLVRMEHLAYRVTGAMV